MNWRITTDILIVVALGAFAFVPWSFVAKGVRELWLTWKGKSRKRIRPRE